MNYIYEKVQQAYFRNKQVDRPEIWIYLAPETEVLDQAQQLDQRIANGENLPLAGYIIAVKDNIDVAGMPTTAGAKSYTYHPDRDAFVVAQLRAAGAIILGKTNLDQFATGLVGTRSPFGAVRNSIDPERISGGSSSGSAVATALGIVDFALGTDTAGSGRVPAALNEIIGIKPSLGIVSNTGVVPACRSIDCVTVFARNLQVASVAFEHMIGFDPEDPFSRALPAHTATIFSPSKSRNFMSAKIIAIPLAEQLTGLAPGWREAFDKYVAQVKSAGFTVEERDISPLLEAALLLYGPQFVAERYSAVGAFISQHRDLIGNDLDPTVAKIILGGENARAWELFDAKLQLQTLIAQGIQNLAGTLALLTPTTAWHPTIAEVQADPIGANSRMGKYTNFCNLGDFAAIAVPAGTVNDLPFGVMYTGPALSDRHLQEIAAQIGNNQVEIFVVGAHRKGQVLNHELISLGGRWKATVETSPKYRLHALDTIPEKPGLERTAETMPHGIEGEVWILTPEAYAHFVSKLPQPMVIGAVELQDGSYVSGFLCEPIALLGAKEITEHKSWLSWLKHK